MEREKTPSPEEMHRSIEENFVRGQEDDTELIDKVIKGLGLDPSKASEEERKRWDKQGKRLVEEERKKEKRELEKN